MKHLQTTLYLLIFSTLSICFNPFILSAEGTSSIAPSTADEAALFVGAGNTGVRGGDYGLFAWKGSNSKLYFNVQNSCEKVFIGFSKPRNDRSFADTNPNYGGSGIEEDLIFRIIDPLGNPINNLACFGNTNIGGEIWQTLNSSTANISSRAAADNGPTQLGNIGGYNAFELDLSACGLNLTGNYSIEFYTTDTNYDPNNSRAGFYIPYFDITVADCANTGVTGRVWSNNWGIGIKRDGDGSFDRAFNGSLYVCSAEGFITKIDFNTQINTRTEAGKNTDQRSGFRAGSFNISFNQNGPGSSGDIITDRQSVMNINSTNPELPVFLNLPDESFCPVREIGEIKAATNFLTGCPEDRCINIAATQLGQFEIIVEGANGNGILDQPSERRLIYVITEADKVTNPETEGFVYEACIPWDGKDGNGNSLLEVAITVTGDYFQGIYHFPVYDAEFNDDGFIVETVRPALGRQLLYYDDTNIAELNNSSESKDGTNGCVGPCHSWTGEWENYSNADDNFGNYNTINTWWFASTTSQDFTSALGQLEPLTITCPVDFNGCTNQSTDPTITGKPTINFEDANCLYTLDYTDLIVASDCTGKTIERTWYVYFNNNSSDRKTCKQTIKLIAPVLINCPEDVILDCTDSNIHTWQAPTTEGDCNGTVIQISGPESGSTFSTGITTIVYQIENGCGQTQTCSFTVTVNTTGSVADLTISCPNDFTGCIGQSTEPNVTGTATITPNLPGCDYVLDYNDNIIENGCDGKTIERTWVVYFVNNPNERKTCKQLITLETPTLTNCPSDVTLGCTDSNIYTWQPPTIEGNCGGKVIQTNGPASGSSFPTGTTTIAYQIEDGCGETQTCSFTVTVNTTGSVADLTINCPNDVTGCVGQSTDPNITGTATITPNIAGCDYTLDYQDIIVDNGCGGKIIERTWVVYFGSNPNERKTCKQTILLETPTLMNCPSDVVLGCTDSNIYTWQPPTAVGNCGGTVIQTSGPSSGSTFPSGTTVITYQVGDGCGTTQTCSFTVTVNSGQPADLTINCPPNYASCSEQSTDPSITGTATITATNINCPYVLDYTDVILSENGCTSKSIERTWFVYLENNPSIRKTCVQTITLDAPTLTNCPSDIVLDCTNGNTYTWQPPTSSGGCTNCSDTLEVPDFLYMGERGGHRYYCSRTKANWHQAKASAEQMNGYLVVLDDPAENAFCASFLVNQFAHIGLTDAGNEGHFTWINGAPLNHTNWYEDQPNNYNNQQHYGQLVQNGKWNDGDGQDILEYIVEVPCANIRQTSGPLNGSTFPNGTSTIIYEIGDGCGTTTTCNFTVTVTSNMEMDCPNDVVLDCDNNKNGAIYTWSTPTASSCCTDCPSEGADIAGFVYMGSFNGHQYYCSKEKATWQQAKTTSEQAGGYLAVINDTQENQFLAAFLTNQSAFIGLHDANQEGNFEWINSETMSYSNWYPGQPNNYRGNQDYVRLLPDGRWDDVYPYYELEYMMELPCVSVQQIEGPTSGSVFPAGTTDVAYLIEDACGNQEICDFQVTVNPCEEVADYCECTANSTNYFWIRHIVCGDINNQSTSQGGYSDFTNISTDIQPGSTQTLILSPGFSNHRYYVNWRVWIDYNRDGDFEDANEEVLTYQHYNILKLQFSVPQQCGIGPTRMRISMKYGSASNGCEVFNYGEVEDYTVNLLPPADDLQSVITNNRINKSLEVEIIEHESTAAIKETLTEENPTIKVFPNPVRNNLNVQFFDYKSELSQLKIYNNLGQVVLEEVIKKRSIQELAINVDDLPNGIYLLSIESKGMQPIVQKFTKN